MSLFKKLEERRQSQESGVKVFLLDPDTNEPTEFYIEICGPDTRQAVNARQASITEVVRALEGQAPSTADEIEVGIRTLARCVISWNVTDPDGNALRCDFDNACGLFRNYPSIQAQCDRKASDRENFTIG